METKEKERPQDKGRQRPSELCLDWLGCPGGVNPHLLRVPDLLVSQTLKWK